MLLFTAFAFFFVSAGVVHSIDVLSAAPQFSGTDIGGSFYFHDAFYFLIVTITTVGYGDIHPQEIAHSTRGQPLTLTLSVPFTD